METLLFLLFDYLGIFKRKFYQIISYLNLIYNL